LRHINNTNTTTTAAAAKGRLQVRQQARHVLLHLARHVGHELRPRELKLEGCGPRALAPAARRVDKDGVAHVFVDCGELAGQQL
jgi:hypothetical protein